MGTTTDYMFNPGSRRRGELDGHDASTSPSPAPRACSRRRSSYGISHCTDGTSNTVAYAESLLGDSMATSVWGTVTTPPSKYRGNMVYGADPADDLNRPHDAFQNPALVMTMLQNCNAMFQSTSTNIGDDHGYRWSMGITGYSLFNTIQTPNDAQFPFSACRLDGDAFNYPDSGFAYGSSSAHPGGINVALATAASGSSRTASTGRPGGRWAPRPTARSSAPIAIEPAARRPTSLPGRDRAW